MKIKEVFFAFIDCFEDLGKEVFSFLVLGTGLILLIKGLVSGQQYTDLVKTIGVAYIGGCAVGSTSDAIIKHLETRALAIKDKLEGNK
jgi:hypothetical protein